MATTHGAAADAEIARMERESGGSRSIPTKTFKDAKSAIANAKSCDEGEISKADFERIEKKMIAQDQEGHLRECDKTYGKERD